MKKENLSRISLPDLDVDAFYQYDDIQGPTKRICSLF